MVNEVNMHLKIAGLPRFFVKHAHNTSVRHLIQKIENHPDRHAIQREQRQRHQFYVRISQSFNCFSPESDKIIQDVGKIKLSELLETEPNAMHSVVIILEHWNSLLHVRAFSCTKKQGPINNSSVTRWTFFQHLRTSSRKEDFMDIDLAKSQETKNLFG